MRSGLTAHFPYKAYGRIFVYDYSPEKEELIRRIIRSMDSFEYNYMPDDMITGWAEYPKLVYTGKFDDLDTNDLTARCFQAGVFIMCVGSGNEWPSLQHPEDHWGDLPQLKDMTGAPVPNEWEGYEPPISN